MVERLVRNEEVSGSIPLGSTKPQEIQCVSPAEYPPGFGVGVWCLTGASLRFKAQGLP